jgi:E1A/CREB-binding protein
MTKSATSKITKSITSISQEILGHSKTCAVTTKRGCPICKRIQNLINMHSRSCRDDKCIVPNCKELKDHFK